MNMKDMIGDPLSSKRPQSMHQSLLILASIGTAVTDGRLLYYLERALLCETHGHS